MGIKFSIIVPVYNTRQYLRECVNSIICQNYSNYEILLIDDGSTDGSDKIVDELEREYSQIKGVHKENEGLLMTRLCGYQLAIGDYIVNLDADDKLRSDALTVLATEIEREAPDLIQFCASVDEEYIDTWSNCILNIEHHSVVSPIEFKRIVCSTAKINNMAMKCVKHDLIDGIEVLRKYKFMNNEEDLVQTLFVLNKCIRPMYLNENIYFYRQDNAGSISNNFNNKIFESIKASGLAVREYADKWKNEDPTLPQLVFNRNVKSCASIIRYYYLKQKDNKARVRLLETMKIDEFFVSSYLYGKRTDLALLEKFNLFNLYHGQIGLINIVMNFRKALKRKA